MALKCAAWLLALLLCLPLGGMAEGSGDAFSLAEGLTWATPAEEAQRWLGEGAEFEENEDEDLGKLGLVARDDLQLLDLPCGRAALIYYNDALVYATFYFTEEAAGAEMGKLIEAEAKVLGEATMLDDIREEELPEELDRMRVRCRWNPDSDTQVSVLEILEEDYPYSCTLFFENLPVEELLRIAMEVE